MIDKILRMKERPSGILSINDFVATGVLRGGFKAKVRVPEYLSVTVFDDISMFAQFYPTISTSVIIMLS